MRRWTLPAHLDFIMEIAQARATMAIALMAALADGRTDEGERAQWRRVADALGSELDFAALLADVLDRRVSLDGPVAVLATPEARRLAFELAVGVCDANGLRNEAETRFLAQLGQQLGLEQPAIVETAIEADRLATLPLPASESEAVALPADRVSNVPNDTGIDRLILDAAVLNGALELLPQSLASMAIVPLQMRLVHRIGRMYGVDADKTQIRELLTTLGVGITGQYLEQIARRLLRGWFGGGPVAALARGATGSMLSFAATYAIGHVARRYYAEGRAMSSELLQRAFADLRHKAERLLVQYLPQIEERARSIDPARIVQLVQSH